MNNHFPTVQWYLNGPRGYYGQWYLNGPNTETLDSDETELEDYLSTALQNSDTDR